MQINAGTGRAYSIDNMGGLVAATQGPYAAAARVNGPAGHSVSLNLRERRGEGTDAVGVASSVAHYTLQGVWQKLAVTLEVKQAGDLLDVYVQQDNSVKGDSFLISDLTVKDPAGRVVLSLFLSRWAT